MSFKNVWIWVASYHLLDDESKPLMTGTSLLELQNYVIKKCEKTCKYQNELGDIRIEYVRERRHNKITFTIQSKSQGEVFEWYTIRKVRSFT